MHGSKIENETLVLSQTRLSLQTESNKMADRQQLLQEFMSVTGANAERSQFYLEAAAWELHVRMFLLDYYFRFSSIVMTK